MNVTKDRLTYDITINSDVSRATALRLEVLTDPSVPDQRLGPGDGNFLLSEIEVQISDAQGKSTGRSVKIKSAEADYSQRDILFLMRSTATQTGVGPLMETSFAGNEPQYSRLILRLKAAEPR